MKEFSVEEIKNDIVEYCMGEKSDVLPTLHGRTWQLCVAQYGYADKYWDGLCHEEFTGNEEKALDKYATECAEMVKYYIDNGGK